MADPDADASRRTALDCVEAGIAAAAPEQVVADAVAVDGETLCVDGDRYALADYERVLVLGGGKAAAGVAGALQELLGDRLDGGLVVTDDAEDAETTGPVEVIEGGHPVPDERGEAGAQVILETAAEAGPETLVLAVLTGGGSALLPAPAEGLTLDDLQSVTEALLDAGASIAELNAVRKHCSRLKGGRLAAVAVPATVLTLACSDVVGDDPSVIASGPTVPDETTFADAIAVLDRYAVRAPIVRGHLEAGRDGEVSETPDAPFDHATTHVLAGAWTAVAAAREAVPEDHATCVLSTRLTGEGREVGRTLAAVAAEIHATGNPVASPAVVLSAGETTVSVEGDGEGGPNQELALAAARDLPPGAVLAAVDTDGRDGSTDAAGAVVSEATWSQEAADALAANDVYPYLDARDALVRTGRTGTNVNDLHALVVPDV